MRTIANTKTRVNIEMIDPKPMSEADIIQYYAPLNSPHLTGIPTAPTASANTNSTQIATTAFVKTQISNLVNSAPAALDTLGELANVLGDPTNLATDIITTLGNKVSTNSANYIKSVTNENPSTGGTKITFTKNIIH